MEEQQAYSVDRFCDAHDIGRVTFYALLKAGRGPRIFKVGARTLISAEAAREWRESLERETAQRVQAVA